MQLRKESLKKSGLPGFEPWPLRYRCSALTNWANKPTGSWSLNWFVIYPGKMKMKLWIYETHIFELWNKEMNVKKILAVINVTYAVAKRKPEKIRLAGIRTLTSAIPVQCSNSSKGGPDGHGSGFWLVEWRHDRKWDGIPLTSWKKGSWAHPTGSHVIWKEKPLTSGKKGSWAQVGRKVQSPILGTGVILESKKRGKLMLLKIFLMETIEGSSIWPENKTASIPFDNRSVPFWWGSFW